MSSKLGRMLLALIIFFTAAAWQSEPPPGPQPEPAPLTETEAAVEMEGEAGPALPGTVSSYNMNELGDNDLRLSDMGANGNTNYTAAFPAVAYSSAGNLYVTVWEGEENSDAMVDNEFEIFGQRINAATGQEIGSDYRISSVGPDGNIAYRALQADIVYNPDANQFLVVYAANPVASDEYEIYAQRLSGSNGNLVGGAIRVSNMGSDGDDRFDAFRPSVAYNPQAKEYLVVWNGDHAGATVDEEMEIFGQRIEGATGAIIGNDFRISNMGPALDPEYDAYDPDVAYNAAIDQYVVVYTADTNTGGFVNEEFEIYLRRITPLGGLLNTGPNRITDNGTRGSALYWATAPDIACSTDTNQCLLAWNADSNANGQVDEEYEIFSTRLIMSGTTNLAFTSPLLVSDMGPTLGGAYGGTHPKVVYNPFGEEYFIVWWGTDSIAGFANTEAFGQRIGLDAARLGSKVRLSDMGPETVDTLIAWYPAVAYNLKNREYLAVWSGDDNIAPLANNEYEIFGQRLTGAPFFQYLPVMQK